MSKSSATFSKVPALNIIVVQVIKRYSPKHSSLKPKMYDNSKYQKKKPFFYFIVYARTFTPE